MKAETFDQIVKNRAHERALARIREFKKTVMEACAKLTGAGNGYDGINRVPWHDDFREIFSILAGECPNKGWPAKVWREEEEKVRTELLNIMDEMQKALLSPAPKDTDEKPIETEGAA